MRPRIVDYFNRVLDTNIFDYLVPYPALMYALAMLICLIIFANRAKDTKVNQFHAIGALVTGMICGLIGARLLFVIIYYENYPDFMSAIFAVTGATISWGAYSGGIAGFIGYLLIRRKNVLPYLDLSASVMGLGVCIGRISCFLNGCDFGKLSELPWAVSFPAGSIPYVDQVNRGLLSTSTDLSLPIHPAQLYLSLNGLILFIVFSYLWKINKFKTGALFILYWMTYSITRFFLEFLRGDSSNYYFDVLTIGQVITIVIFFMSLFSMIIYLIMNKEFKYKLQH